MNVDHGIALGQQHRLDVVGDHRRRAAIGVAGEAAVQVEPVDRRIARAGTRCRRVGRGQDDDPAGDLFRPQGMSELAQGDLALELVAVVAGHQQDGRPRTIAQADDGNRDPAIGRPVDRVRQAQEVGLPPVAVEVDFSGDPGHAGPDNRRAASTLSNGAVSC
jgi:hypothetical protein